ncbi:MFS transporter [Leuconostoc lactis]|uniref:MFS transporter n=1 Tax=Leuconostoc lactis TaxID=1246 RepID=UPI000AF2FB87|nr:MFS transporter [Leuconostoc lactis]
MIASAYVCIAFSPGIGGGLVAGGLIGLGFALLMPLMNAVVLRDILPAQRGRATAIFSSGTDVAYGMGAIIWGIFASHFGYFAVYCVAAILVATTLSLVMRYRQML